MTSLHICQPCNACSSTPNNFLIALHIHRSCITCSSTPNKFISSITQSHHFFLGLPAGRHLSTLTSPSHPTHPPALFKCPNHLSLLCLNLAERSSTPHISATSLLDLLSCHLTPATFLSILRLHLCRTSISLYVNYYPCFCSIQYSRFHTNFIYPSPSPQSYAVFHQ